MTAIRSLERENLIQFGGNQENRQARVALLNELVMDELDRTYIQSARRLSCQKNLGLARQFTRQHHLLRIPARQAAGQSVHRRCAHVISGDLFVSITGDRFAIRPAAARERRIADALEHQIFGDGEVSKHAHPVTIRWNMREAGGADRVRARVGGVLSADANPAGGWPAQPGDRLLKLRLTVPGHPGDAQDLPRAHFQSDAA